MHILLVAPASGTWRGIARKKIFNGKTFRFSMLSLLTVAALTPVEHDVTIIDEQLDTIPEGPFDLVGITVMTATAPRAFELSAEFRSKGIPVVFGGFFPTLNPAECLHHASSIVEGPASGAWPKILADIERGTLKKRYEGHVGLKPPEYLPRDNVSRDQYVTVNATYATMGCYNRCSFCSIAAFHRGQFHCRPIGDVISEISSFREKFFIFVDDNLTQDRSYVYGLLEALIPLKKHWVTQASIDIADDPYLLSLLRDAGCIGLFIGLESFDNMALKSQGKEIKSVETYKKAISTIHSSGLFVESGMIVGFDTDDVTVFGKTLKMLDYLEIDAIQLSILTPLPGTALHRAMKNRIVDTNLAHYDYRHAVFSPARMTREDLQAGADWIIGKFYSPLSIVKRMVRWLKIGGLGRIHYPLFLNAAYYGRVKRFSIGGYNPAFGQSRVFQSSVGRSLLRFRSSNLAIK